MTAQGALLKGQVRNSMRTDLGKLILHTLLVLAVTMAAVGLILWGYQRSAQVPTTMQKWAAITWIGFIAGLSVYIFLPHRLFLSRLLTALLATISGLWLLGWLAPSYGGAGLYDQPKPNWDGLVQLLFGGLIATWTLMILEYILPRKKVLASREMPSGAAISAGMPAPAASARQPKRKSWKPWKSLEELAQKYGPNTSTHTQHEAGSVQPQPRKSAAKKKASSSGKSKPNGSSKRTRSDVPQKKTSAKKNTQVQSRNNSVPPTNRKGMLRYGKP